jgi:hypothetical protein
MKICQQNQNLFKIRQNYWALYVKNSIPFIVFPVTVNCLRAIAVPLSEMVSGWLDTWGGVNIMRICGSITLYVLCVAALACRSGSVYDCILPQEKVLYLGAWNLWVMGFSQWWCSWGGFCSGVWHSVIGYLFPSVSRRDICLIFKRRNVKDRFFSHNSWNQLPSEWNPSIPFLACRLPVFQLDINLPSSDFL